MDYTARIASFTFSAAVCSWRFLVSSLAKKRPSRAARSRLLLPGCSSTSSQSDQGTILAKAVATSLHKRQQPCGAVLDRAGALGALVSSPSSAGAGSDLAAARAGQRAAELGRLCWTSCSRKCSWRKGQRRGP